MAAAGGSGEGIGSSGGDAGGHGHGPAAAQLIEALRKGQEEVDGMGNAEVLAFEARLRALRLRVLQRIKEKEAAAKKAEQQQQQPQSE